MAARKSIPERFWSKVERGSANECWNWTATVLRSGYGAFKIEGRKNGLAHRIAYELTHGEIPHGDHFGTTCVCHRCDNRLCCNPNHLWLGTNADNVRDRDAKHRHKALRGSRVKHSKLTEEQVAAMRRDPRTSREIANEYGMSYTHIIDIRKRRMWKHVP